MNKRYLGAVLLSPMLIFLFIGGVYLKYFTLILSLIGMHEFYTTVKQKNINPLKYIGYMLCIIYYILLSNTIKFDIILLLIIAGVFIMLCIPIINVKYNFIDLSITIFGFLYIGVFFSFIVLINQKSYGNYLIWLVFISSWLCDTAAYYVGKYLGMNKLCPRVSPKKTIEGSIGGLFGSIIGCTLFGMIITKLGVNIHYYNYILIGILCGIFSQFGDLSASSIKRYVNVKDYSNLIPGHGGILDRFDSILFTSVVVYYYITFVMGI
ncbi:phosphatidate cytidylyltransferase [Clostridium sp. SYSU_GA19001]|uniref:phosphatidate cytidylyltransferase n=1 Tax=Clostridium caldaquaticum TaxID=2940653 RepID=UPI002077875E|nr:phosphatidate cytidylyltransferase [Clostridium caldaquaticum]MCM8710619.1 phosphatidate cytidylyltransferase [Clostridium caldaquaticum]